MTDARTEQLAANLVALRAGIERACAEAGRDPSGVSIVAVTKTWPVDDVRRLAELGLRDMGENRDQEAAGKARACADLGLTWHFVGQLQTNKAASVAGYAAVVHSVDRGRLVSALDRAAAARERRVRVLVQVSLDPVQDEGRGGVPAEGLLELADRVASADTLDLGGVMAVAPAGAEPGPAFGRLADLAALLRSHHPEATWISAGMTHDHLEAVRHGATHVRVGSALLGNRPPLR